MKKKIFFAIVLIILVISEISIVYADIIIPGQHFNSYNNDKKITAFLKRINSPIKEVTVVATIFTFILGMVILVFNDVKDKNNNDTNNSGNILKKIYLGLSFVLNLLQIQILRYALIFHSDFTGVRSASAIRENRINHMIIPVFYIAYAIIMISLLIIDIKRKKEKRIYIITTIITISLFIICAFIVYITPAGYYTYDNGPFGL